MGIRASATVRAGHLYGPVWDFALLGGGSLFALAAIAWYFHGDPAAQASAAAATLALANVVNNPHFAHSYQIFYRDFAHKLIDYPDGLRWRYLAGGVVVPLLLALTLYLPIVMQSPRALGLAANAMFFFVGWHYVKQGYGMAMLDAALKRAFYSDGEKRALLRNAYAVWIFAWLLVNNMLQGELSYWGIPYSALPIPGWCANVAGLVAGLTTVQVAVLLHRRRRAGRPIAANGLLAYAASLYAWLLLMNPIVMLWVPLFHSLQYMAVVWRYQVNRAQRQPGRIHALLRHAGFALAALALGYAGFWLLPKWLDRTVDYDHSLFGPALFLFLFWIFINVHHYFLDAVMWRKGNPDVQRYLFDAP